MAAELHCLFWYRRYWASTRNQGVSESHSHAQLLLGLYPSRHQWRWPWTAITVQGICVAGSSCFCSLYYMNILNHKPQHVKNPNKTTWSKLPTVNSLSDPAACLWVRGGWESLTGRDRTEFPCLDSAKQGSIADSIQRLLLSSSSLSSAYKYASGEQVDAKRACPVQREAVHHIACQGLDGQNLIWS